MTNNFEFADKILELRRSRKVGTLQFSQVSKHSKSLITPLPALLLPYLDLLSHSNVRNILLKRNDLLLLIFYFHLNEISVKVKYLQCVTMTMIHVIKPYYVTMLHPEGATFVLNFFVYKQRTIPQTKGGATFVGRPYLCIHCKKMYMIKSV